MTSSQTDYNNVTEKTPWIYPPDCFVYPMSKFAPSENPNNLISRETFQYIAKVVNVYVLMLFLGLFGPLNILNAIVFWKQGIKERINLCLVCLSVSDIIVVTISFVLDLDRIYATLANVEYKIILSKMNNVIDWVIGFDYVSGFMSMLIAFERCLCVVSPLRAQRMLQTRTTAVIILVGHVVIIGGYNMVAMKRKIVCMFDPTTGQTYDMYYNSQFYFKHQEIINVFEGLIYGLLFPGLFIAGVTISTIITVVKLRQMKEWREQASSVTTSGVSAVKDVSLTRMLIGTSVLFVACSLPPVIFRNLHYLIPDLSLTGDYYNLFYTLSILRRLCFYINSSFNFFIYYYFGTKFRRTVKHMFQVCPTEKK